MLENRWEKKQEKLSNSDLFLSYVTQYPGNILCKVVLNFWLTKASPVKGHISSLSMWDDTTLYKLFKCTWIACKKVGVTL